jgi:phage terminase Nu1 subunit (DNA packaging protein)
LTSFVSKNEYAKMRNILVRQVNRAIKDGRISDALTEDNLIDVDVADRLWAANTDPSRGWHGQLRNQPDAARIDADELVKKAKAAGVNVDAPPTMAESKTLEAAYKAQLARLEYEEKTGELLNAEKVRKESFKLARVTRDAMLAIPDRVSAELAGLTDPFAIHQKLMVEIRNAIAEVAGLAGEADAQG